jgi:type I restriction enzyme S subunit
VRLLGEFVKQIRGITYNKSQAKKEYSNGYIPIYRAGNISSSKVIDQDFVYVPESLVKEERLLKYGDILIAASSGSLSVVGKAAMIESDRNVSFGAFCTVLRPVSDELAPRYLKYFFETSYYKSTIRHLAEGANINNLKSEHFKQLKISIPSLEEQKKIADILDAADSLRQKDKQLVEHYDRLSQSLFLDMFGDPVANPKQWNISSLKEAGKVSTGNTPPRANLANYGDHIEWIKTTNINTPNMYLTKAEECLSIEGESIGRCVDVNSLLVTCIAGSKKVIGNVAIANRKVAFNQQINSFIPKSGNILFYYYLFVVGKAHVQTFSTDSMKGMINKSKFESIDFIFPPIDKQNEFSEAVQLIQEQKELAQQALLKSEDLFNSLLQRAFKGELTNC